MGGWVRDAAFGVSWIKADKVGKGSKANCPTFLATKGPENTPAVVEDGEGTEGKENSKAKGERTTKDDNKPNLTKLPTYQIYLFETMLLFFPKPRKRTDSSRLLLDEVIPLSDIVSIDKTYLGMQPWRGESLR